MQAELTQKMIKHNYSACKEEKHPPLYYFNNRGGIKYKDPWLKGSSDSHDFFSIFFIFKLSYSNSQTEEGA